MNARHPNDALQNKTNLEDSSNADQNGTVRMNPGKWIYKCGRGGVSYLKTYIIVFFFYITSNIS